MPLQIRDHRIHTYRGLTERKKRNAVFTVFRGGMPLCTCWNYDCFQNNLNFRGSVGRKFSFVSLLCPLDALSKK